MIRKQNDTTLRPEERRNYKNVFDAFSRIIKEEGILALWRGCSPTVLKAMATNFGGLGPYDEVKERMNKWRGTIDTMESRIVYASFCLSCFILNCLVWIAYKYI